MPSLFSISSRAASSSRRPFFSRRLGGAIFDASLHNHPFHHHHYCRSSFYHSSGTTVDNMSPHCWNAPSRSVSATARSSDHVKSNYQSVTTTATASKDTANNIDNNNGQPQQNEVVDWRTWFNSHEYDDAWSSYRPLDHLQTTTQSSNNNNNNNSNNDRTTTVGDILVNFNSWTRRRHGMNLEPLTLLINGNNVVDHHEDKNDNEDNVEDRSPSSSSTSKLQKRIQWIDTQTRFTIQMLNDMYYTGIRRQMDRPTTERCHRMIGRLVSLTPRPPRVGQQQHDEDEQEKSDEQPKINLTGAAQRGNAILERMEWCSPAFLPQLRKWQQQQQRRDGLRLNFNEDIPSSSSSTTSTSTAAATTLSNYQNKVQQHLIQSKQSIPSPTLPIYNMVLLLYSKEYAPSRYICEQAEDVVWSMIVRGLQLEEFYYEIEHTTHHDKSITSKSDNNKNKKNFRQILEEEKGVSLLTTTPMYPTTEHWNGVLQCWSNSSDPNRAFYAYKFFKCWLEWNDVSRSGGGGSGSSSGGEGATGGKEEELLPKEEKEPSSSTCCDLETFHLMLKACVVEESDTFYDNEDGGSGNSNKNDVTEQRAKEVGSRVAIGLWKEIRDHADAEEITLTSYTYHQLLRALCQTSDRSKGSLSTMAKIYQRCRIDGMDTIELTNLVRDSMTETQFEKLLRGTEG